MIVDVPAPTGVVRPLQRRLAVVAFADIVGWSTLTTADETAAVSRWMALFQSAVDPAAERLGGRIVDVQGDGTLAEFPHMEAALDWARTLHAAAESEAQAAGEMPPIAFRIALHLGPVIDDGARVLGDAVNLAARLQEFGTPGGTLLSAEAAAMLPAEALAGARELGELPLRNLSRSVRAVSLDPARSVAVPLAPPPARLPSVAVLPLANLGGDPRDDYLAAGLVEDIAAMLAGLHEVFVIAPETTRMFARQSPTPQRIGRTLGVQFAVLGSMLRARGGLAVSVRLVDTRTGEELWGERIDAPEREILDMQDHLVGRIVTGIAPGIQAAVLRDAMRKRPESLTAYDHMLRGIHAFGSGDREAFLGARKHLQQAIDLDPGFALPRAWAAYWHNIHIADGLSSDHAAEVGELFRLGEEALALDPRCALALSVIGHNLSFLRRDYDHALEHFQQALGASPGTAAAWTFASGTLAYLGRGGEAVEHAERGIRLSPFGPLRFYRQLFLGIAQYANGDLVAAEKACRASIGSNPRHAPTLRMLAAVLGGLGRHEEAREAGRRLLVVDPGFRLGSYARDRAPFAGELRARFVRDLAASGLPE
jgi:adenylate cyclase